MGVFSVSPHLAPPIGRHEPWTCLVLSVASAAIPSKTVQSGETPCSVPGLRTAWETVSPAGRPGGSPLGAAAPPVGARATRGGALGVASRSHIRVTRGERSSPFGPQLPSPSNRGDSTCRVIRAAVRTCVHRALHRGAWLWGPRVPCQPVRHSRSLSPIRLRPLKSQPLLPVCTKEPSSVALNVTDM